VLFLLIEVDQLPCKSTSLNLNSELGYITRKQIVEELDISNNLEMHRDATTKRCTAHLNKFGKLFVISNMSLLKFLLAFSSVELLSVIILFTLFKILFPLSISELLVSCKSTSLSLNSELGYITRLLKS
jgi:hypothetical protein